MQNAFGAGQDALLNFLADREARQRLAEDRARRSEMDAANEMDRQTQRELQRQQIEETAKYRQNQEEALKDMRAAAAERSRAEAAAKTEGTTAAKQMHDDLLAASLDASLTPQQRLSAWYKLHNINPVGDVQTGRDSAARIAEANARAAASLANSTELMTRRHDLAEQDRDEKKDNPKLPIGVRDWLDTLASAPIEQARAQLQGGFKQQRAVHPNVDLAEASKYLDSLYTQDNDVLTGGKKFTPKFTAPKAPAAAPAAPAAGGGMVKLQAPNGQVSVVPAAEAAHYVQLGAKVIQ